ncbi:hypothetical protein [Methylocella silvestris]|uniref:Uncharacterized protein n=1 Tax=Methylocella silvestris TaxID=199596 RepID=A0A2J7TDP1_METSI|nr:hypothetical protein [Methylocella silvestris]PNG24881.1 hypothetical protein CR492_16140 [Methylocella silvestris]
MTYSVQQIKFELISYVKEFGGDFREWSVGVADDAPKALFEINEVDPVRDIWLWKPAVSAAAAKLVHAWMTGRQRANSAPTSGAAGASVFMFKKTN